MLRGGVVSPFTTIGSGSDTVGYWLGDIATNRLVVAPKSTEVKREWGSNTTVRGTTSTTNGLANTTTLFNLGAGAHPAAHYARSLTTGGYTTWYLPAKDELNTLYSNKSATPFATANSFIGSNYMSSTENTGSFVWFQYFDGGYQNRYGGKGNPDNVRAIRRSTV